MLVGDFQCSVPAVGKYGMGYPQGNMLLLVKGQSMEEYPWMLPRQVLALLDREGFSKKKVIALHLLVLLPVVVSCPPFGG